MNKRHDDAFLERREAARATLDHLPGNCANNSEGRLVFFDAVYEEAQGDEAAVPWADLEPKAYLVEWLKDNSGVGKKAVDIGCGLGDNAEAIAQAGYETTAFDIVEKAIEWAVQRFPKSDVAYRAADLFAPPEEWIGGFDFVHECYTLQALPPDMVEETYAAICRLLAPSGTLLIFTRYRKDGVEVNGPPWALEERLLDTPAAHGLIKMSERRFDIKRRDNDVPHHLSLWQKP